MLAGCAAKVTTAVDTVMAWTGFAVMAVILMALNRKRLAISGLSGFVIGAIPVVGTLTWFFGNFAHLQTHGALPMDYSRALMATVFLVVWMVFYLIPDTNGRGSGTGGCGGSSGCSSSGCGGCGGD